MLSQLHRDAQAIIQRVILENLPEEGVRQALDGHKFLGNIWAVAIGKAAWTMAKAAGEHLGERLKGGVVITKYGHAKGDLPGMEIIEAGHPISDENTFMGTEKAIALAERLGKEDELLFLVSGGGSALFEAPMDGIGLSDLAMINNCLLACGADIIEINMIRKRLSKVKAGRFAKMAEPARVFAVVLSDVLGDRLDTIASGPAAPDLSCTADAQKIISTYEIKLTELQRRCILEETPKDTPNVKTIVTGSVRTLCQSAGKAAEEQGYKPFILTTSLGCHAREAGHFLASIARDIQRGESSIQKPCAVIAGGETVVRLTGTGKGGRNQELVLSAAKGISGLADTVIFSVGSDGTDGPTDAAGGIVDGETLAKLQSTGISIDMALADNDSYNALKAVGGLVITGPTGTNVNDTCVVLCR